MSTPQPVEPSAEPTPEEVGSFAFQVASQMSGAVTAAMIHLGDRLGLYRALHDAGRPLTSTELADATGLVERWVREWAYNQGAAGLLAVEAVDAADATDPARAVEAVDAPEAAGEARSADASDASATGSGPGAADVAEPTRERFSLVPAAVPVLVDEGHESNLAGLFHQLPQTMAQLQVLPDSFRTGIGYDFDSGGPEAAVGVERGFGPWMGTHLVADLLPLLDGVVDRLKAGIAVADVGCGSGGALFELAPAFPASTFVGYDISRHALDRAAERLAETGLTNVAFHDPRDRPLPADGSLGLITTFDCLHDMTDPTSVVRALRPALADDGTWLLADIKAYDTFAENAERNPMAAMMYGTSVLSCMSSALSEPGGAGLGTLGMTARRAEAMARAAGFTRFRRIEIDHPVNAFYEIRP